MRTITTKNGIVTLTPETGKAITNGSITSDSTVYLGKFDSPDNWTDCEIPIESETDEIDFEQAYNELTEVLDNDAE